MSGVRLGRFQSFSLSRISIYFQFTFFFLKSLCKFVNSIYFFMDLCSKAHILQNKSASFENPDQPLVLARVRNNENPKDKSAKLVTFPDLKEKTFMKEIEKLRAALKQSNAAINNLWGPRRFITLAVEATREGNDFTGW